MERCAVSLDESGPTLQVTLRGIADVAAASELHARLLEVVAADRDVVLRAGELESLDGAGLQLLMALKTTVERAHHACSVDAGDGPVRRAIELAGAHSLLDGDTQWRR